MTKNQEVSHTAGPWEYAQDKHGRWRVYSGEREVVRALSTHGLRKLSKTERAANARLIAQAPQLLEHAKLLERALVYEISRSRAEGDDEGARMKQVTLAMVRETIAKTQSASKLGE